MKKLIDGRVRPLGSAAACVGLIVGLLGLASPSFAEPGVVQPEQEQEAQLVWSLTPGEDLLAPEGSAPEERVGTMQAVTWAGCGAFDDGSKVVRTFTGPKYLRCGNDSYGYRHLIARGHDTDWSNKAAGTGQNWRDIADIAIEKTLTDPAVVVDRPSNDTKCYSAEIYLVNLSNNQTVGTTIAHTVAGIRSQNVITSFPTDYHCR